MEKSASEVAEVPDSDSSPVALEPPNAAHQSDRNSSRWRIGWLVPTQMVVLLTSGTLLAVGHHLYYNSLAGQPVGKTSQQWATRFGTAFTFLVKACLVSAVSTAYIQHIWVMFRQKSMSIGALDATFSATTDPFSFLSIEMLKRVKIGALLALLTWTIPLATIVPPSTLFVIPAVAPEVLNLPVKAPNFTAAETFVNFNFHHTPGQGSRQPVDTANYQKPIAQLSRLASIALIGGDIVSIESPAPNATYTLQFFGPSVQCDTANSTTMDILSLRMGYPLSASSVTEALAYTAVLNNQEQLLVGWTKTVNGTQIHGVLCELYNTSYTVHFHFTNTLQTVDLLDRTIINPTAISGSTYVIVRDITAPVNTTQFDKSTSPVFQTYSYLGLLTAFANVIVGDLSIAVDATDSTTSVLNTKLGFGPDLNTLASEQPRSILFPNLTIQAGLEEMWFNFTMSLFGADGNVTKYNESTAVTSDIIQNIFQYNTLDLFLAYFFSVLVTTFATLVGIRALYINRVSYAANFSSILRTTRNPNLDQIVRNTASTELDTKCNCMGAKPLPKSLKGKQLKFGIPNGSGHASFDVVEEGQDGAQEDGVQDIRGITECPGSGHQAP
ncbi:uncharacterized protein K444DRAFT_629480 [Hyaloscypha bicolor E]|uniref:Uncharacterized protein n=1 Tax=Hyaloscypha bicolor E TaxID=1095630 RepID=A0A2J6TBZ5_9HELO|nr:uncharacterized protein K444DRAFT_629480 [Hyaloscypha bicolor E]PMD60549.1 hypothetical protein K444DRAFT_629480 [Hyaloscypha bicolor E]